MIVLLNENGYVASYALVGSIVDGIEVPNPADMEHFEMHFEAYGFGDGKLVYNDVWEKMLDRAKMVDEIRKRREKECFLIINRGQLWYDRLTEKQKTELSKWYRDWLDATSTGVVPEKLAWL